MYGMGLDYALNCVRRMLEIFSRGGEPEVEGDGVRVVVAVGKRERAIYLKRWCRRLRKPVDVVTLYKNSVPHVCAWHAFIKGGSTQTVRFDFAQG